MTMEASRMRSRLLHACSLSVVATIICASDAAAPDLSAQQLRKHIGINAVLVVYADNAVENRIRDGNLDKARELITANRLVFLSDLRQFDAEIASEPRVRELRDRIVKDLQARWLKEPPMYLDDQSAEYLERTCAAIPGCTKGRVHPLKQPVLPPTD